MKTNRCDKLCLCHMTDKEIGIYERGFDSGFEVAKRLFKPVKVVVLTEEEQKLFTIKKL